MSERAKRQPELKVYVSATDGLRVIVEKDNLTIEEKVGKVDDNWGVVGYYASWDGVVASLVKRRGFKKLVCKKDNFTFIEAQKEYLESVLKDGTDKVKTMIKKYCF